LHYQSCSLSSSNDVDNNNDSWGNDRHFDCDDDLAIILIAIAGAPAAVTVVSTD
jgi:hypothetical protein